MASHTKHPDSHTHGLSDDCGRCYEHSLHPFESLDETNLRQLMHRVYNNGEARSENERTAMNVVEAAFHKAGRLASLDPLTLAAYVQRHFNVRLILDANAKIYYSLAEVRAAEEVARETIDDYTDADVRSIIKQVKENL